MSIRIIPVYIMLITACPAVVTPQTAEEVINQAVAAHGGRAQILTIRSLKIRGEFENPSEGVAAPFTLYRIKPGKYRINIEYQGKQIVQATDGKQAWDINPFAENPNPKLMSEEHAKDFQRAVAFDGLDELIRWKENGDTAEYVGVVKDDDGEFLHVRFIESDGKECNFFFDADSHLLAKFTRIHVENGQEVERLTILRDYRDVGGGVIMGCTFEMQQGGETILISRVNEFEINPGDVDDALFAFPVEK